MSESLPNLALGIDLGGSSAKIALLGPSGLISTAKTLGYDRPDLAELSRCVALGIEQLEADTGHPLGEVGSLGLCVPGPVDDAGHVIRCANLPCVNGLDAQAWLHEITGRHVPTIVTTDQQAAAHGEWITDPHDARTLYLALGTGVGGALFDHGKPVNLTRGTPGHLGHIDVSGGDPDAPNAPAGGRGSLEAYIGVGALRAAGLPLHDPQACAEHPAMDSLIRALAQGIRIAFAIYRMERVVLMGGVAIIFAPVLDRLREAVADGLTVVAPEQWTLEVGKAGPMAAAIGIAQLAHDAPLEGLA